MEQNENKRTEVKAFVARDKNGELYFYTTEPKLREDGTFIGGGVVSDKLFLQNVARGKFKECVISVKG